MGGSFTPARVARAVSQAHFRGNSKTLRDLANSVRNKPDEWITRLKAALKPELAENFQDLIDKAKNQS